MTSTAGNSNASAGFSAATVTAGVPLASAATRPPKRRRSNKRRSTSANRYAPRQRAYGNLGDFLVRFGVDDGDGVRPATGNVEFFSIRGNRHVPGPLADGNRRDDSVGGGVDHLNRAISPGRYVDALAVGMHGDAVAALASLDARNHIVRLR